MKRLLAIVFIGLVFGGNSQTVIQMKDIGGVYEVPCKVNGLKMNFIFDTGASDVSISLTEALFMFRHGYLKEENILGNVKYSIANGDIAEGTLIIINEIEISGLKLYNVKASIIHEEYAPLLLGQSAIQKLGKYSIDGNTLIIINAPNTNSIKVTESNIKESYHLIIGSFNELKNAIVFLESKILEGYKNSTVFKGPKDKYYVKIGSYSSKDEAIKALSGYDIDAWVLKF